MPNKQNNKSNGEVQSSMTLLVQMFGASLLSIPFLVHKLGAIPSLILLTFTLLSQYPLMSFFIDAEFYTKAKSYTSLLSTVTKPWLGLVLELCIDLSKFGSLTAYIIISAKSFITFSKNVFDYAINPFIMKTIVAFAVIFPLCLLRSLSILSKISNISGLAIFISAMSIIVYYFIGLKKKQLCDAVQYKMELFPQNKSALQQIMMYLQYIPSLQGNFTCHTVIPPLMLELKAPHFLKKRLISVSLIVACVLAMLLYLAVGFLGSHMFGASITNNIIESFSKCGFLWMDIVGLIYAFVVIIAYPLVLYPVRKSMIELCKIQYEGRTGLIAHVVVGIIFVVLTLVLAMFLEDILVIFGFFSALTGFLFYFAAPLLFYMNRHKYHETFAHNVVPQSEQGVVDPLAVAVAQLLVSTISRQSIQAIRRASIAIFGGVPQQTPQENAQNIRRMSLFRPQGLSIKVDDAGTAKLRTYSVLGGDDDNTGTSVMELQLAHEAVVEVEDEMQVRQKKGSTKRDQMKEMLIEDEEITVGEVETEQVTGSKTGAKEKIVGIVGMVVAALVCVAAVLQNGLDMIKSFTKKD